MELPLVETEEEAPLTVSELVGLLQQTLESEYSDILVLGEITNYSAPRSGHRYFTLTDDGASVDCAMWRSSAFRMAFEPQVGDEVICRGYVGVYGRQGRMQLYVRAMKPVGAGAAQRAFEELKRRLATEGLFEPERKRALPFLPRTIGVVTSRNGAAVHDILTTTERRCPGAHVVIAPATVQGAEAPGEIVRALADLAELARGGGCDVAIVGRGGGAAEDLAAFNDESVVRAVAAFPVPIVSAVGHEVDVSLTDLVADHRAATPTAAAEAVVPVRTELTEQTEDLERRLHDAALRAIRNRRHQVGDLGGRLRDPASRVADARQTVDSLGIRLERALRGRGDEAEATVRGLDERLRTRARSGVAELQRRVASLELALETGARRRVTDAGRALGELGSKLGALDPLAVLERGYALVRKSDGRLVRDAAELGRGDVVELGFRTGGARAEIVAVEPARSGKEGEQ